MSEQERQHIFIVNPVSGKEDAGRSMVPLIEKAAADCGIKPLFEMTKAPQHATELAEKHAAEGRPVRLYAVGGDGTLNEVFKGAYPFANAEVASVPCGSGNDFVRSFGVPEDFLDLPSLLRGEAIRIDLMRVDEGICAAITSTGLDAEVAYNIPKYRRIPLLGGTMAYNISIVERLLHRMGKLLRVEIDGKVFEGEFLIATVCNGQTYGGGYRAAPMASLEDGILEVILVERTGRLRIAQIIGKYKRGEHYAQGQIVPEMQDVMQYHRAKEVTILPLGPEPFILNVDGECGPAPRLYAKAMPLAAQFVLPLSLRG
ncbi:YegS/Rv2252/BmrU family lipid kinase [Ruminococcaceae bacterium OttesenSCG-928-I18]|nr:YegS/Rv2252/BmrU family lipid kinase [Ruminococcaceae bacterium OttesenSCG-928-I18]